MALVLDHVFLLTQEYEELAKLLNEIGLKEGLARRHPGQGTANRRFLFANNMLELLYICDEIEAREGAGKDLLLYERSQQKNACPFGLVFRKTHESDDVFPGWAYQPDYFPIGKTFHVGENSSLFTEPLCICAPFFNLTKDKSNDLESIKKLTLTLPKNNLSDLLKSISDVGGLQIQYGEEYLLELLITEKNSRIHDFRPKFPLVIYR